MSRFTQIAANLHQTDKQMSETYLALWKAEQYSKLDDLLDAPAVSKYFHFLGPYFQEFREKEAYDCLPLPIFPFCEDFKKVVEVIEGNAAPYIRRYRIKTKDHGIRFLNNMYFLRKFYSQEEASTDSLLALDHSRTINIETALILKDYKRLFYIYPLKRMFQLVTLKEDPMFVVDISYMFRVYSEVTDVVLRQILPKKPKCFRQIHDPLSMYTFQLKLKNRQLMQDISSLDGKELLDFTIEVPADSHTLLATTKELKHCVHSYSSRVINKECQILNLIKESKRVYTIELRKNEFGYKIIQFKGYANEKTMEDDPGKPYHQELMRLLQIYC